MRNQTFFIPFRQTATLLPTMTPDPTPSREALHRELLSTAHFGSVLRDLTLSISADLGHTPSHEPPAYPQFIDTLVTSAFAKLLTRLSIDPSNDGSDLVACAFDLARHAHQHAQRDEGVAYILHPLRVALILVEEFNISDPTILAAALLHDTIEDTGLTLHHIHARFGPKVATLVDALTKTPEESFAAYLERLAQIGGFDAIAIKVADRVDNLRSLIFLKSMTRRLTCLEETSRLILPLVEDVSPTLFATLNRELARTTTLVRDVELYPQNFHLFLREASLPLHDRLASAPVSTAVMSPHLNSDDFLHFFGASFGMTLSLEISVEAAEDTHPLPSLPPRGINRTALFLEDAGVLGISPETLSFYSELFLPPQIHSPEEHAAARYIIEGSAVGDIVIRANVARSGLTESTGASFLYPYGDETVTWRRFAEFLSSLEAECQLGNLVKEEIARAIQRMLTDLAERYEQC